MEQLNDLFKRFKALADRKKVGTGSFLIAEGFLFLQGKCALDECSA